MLRSLLGGLSAALLFAFVMAEPASAATDPPPEGSYLQTCRVLDYSASSGRLAAMCAEVDDRNIIEKASDAIGASADFRMATEIDTRYCTANSIWNGDGKLYCTTSRPWGAGGAVPKGSYLQSCTEPQISGGVLTARCKDGNNGTRISDLLVEQCRFDRDIWNRYGDLKCEPGSTPAQPLPLRVPLLAPVESQVQTLSPGAAKALSGSGASAPPPPSPSPAAAPDESAGKGKARKRRDRGERG